MMVDVLVCGAMALFLRRPVLTRANVHSWADGPHSNGKEVR